ncbi:MAG: putative heme uptake system protein [Miltoncostaeaceae bacterium]|nr:putative heme uptake system protein [Miltoncostaeaceae bacterium]
MTDPVDVPAPPEPASRAPVPLRRLLVWDAPNIDVALGIILGGRAPKPYERPRFDQLGRWLVERSGPDEVPEACVFANVPQGRADQIKGWVEFLRNIGFAVFAKPKIEEDDDIDQDLLAHILRREAEGPLAEVILASADQFRDFDDDLLELSRRLPVTVLGLREFNGLAMRTEGIGFIDLEDIPALFDQPLARELPLEMLPAEGAWLPPRRDLRELYAGEG